MLSFNGLQFFTIKFYFFNKLLCKFFSFNNHIAVIIFCLHLFCRFEKYLALVFCHRLLIYYHKFLPSYTLISAPNLCRYLAKYIDAKREIFIPLGREIMICTFIFDFKHILNKFKSVLSGRNLFVWIIIDSFASLISLL